MCEREVIKEAKTPRNSTADLIKIVAAFFVVYIHVSSFAPEFSWDTPESLFVDKIMMALAVLAVPIFFAFSGYFFFHQPYANADKKHNAQINKLLVIGGLGSGFYLIFGIMTRGLKNIVALTPTNLWEFFFFNDTAGLFGTAVLWFIFALIYIMFIFRIWPKVFRNENSIMVLAAIGYIIGLLISTAYSEILDTALPNVWSRNWLCRGLLFFAIGYFVHKYQDRYINMRVWKIVLLLLSTFIFYLIEQAGIIFNHTPDYPMSAATTVLPVLVYFLMLLTIKKPNLLKNKIPASLSGTLSLYIYLVHIAVMNIYFLVRYNDLSPKISSYFEVLVNYFIVLAISVIISTCYAQLKRKILHI